MCFDALFHWHEIETLGLSCSESLKEIAASMEGCCVLDGWHLSDEFGELAPRDAVFYVVYAPYQQIISQYRVPVERPDEHQGMFLKWYKKDFGAFRNTVRYFLNTSKSFVETSSDDYLAFVAT